jgi:hypothetical protein
MLPVSTVLLVTVLPVIAFVAVPPCCSVISIGIVVVVITPLTLVVVVAVLVYTPLTSGK